MTGSAGHLHIGTVIYHNGVFSVEMLFTANNFSIGEDEVKSAGQAAARHFFNLMHRNGFHNHGEPEVKLTQHDARTITFYIACRAQRGKPTLVTVSNSVDDTEKKTNGDGRDKVGDET